MPIKVKCPNGDCGKTATVKDEYAGKRGKCPACGTVMNIPNGSAAASAAGIKAPGARRPAAPAEGVSASPAARGRGAPAEAGYDGGGDAWAGAPAPKSGMVTAVAITNFVLGGLGIVCGMLFFFASSLFFGASSAVPNVNIGVQGKGFGGADFGKAAAKFDQAFNEAAGAARAGFGFLGTLMMLISIINIGWGAGAVTSGVGVINRRNWGRLLSMILAAVAGLLGVASLTMVFMGAPAMTALPNLLLYGAYAGWVFWVMLSPQYSREFA